jgi:aminoglycoside 6'-N-acetyltransferase I
MRENKMTIRVRQAQLSDQHHLATMCALLWPDAPIEEHSRELDTTLRTGMYGTLPMAIFISQADDKAENQTPTGFIEVGLRSHADGCDTALPVGFIEGWFVHEAFRNRGVGAALMRYAEDWARKQGCIEIASDTWLDDETSILTHQALGFEVVDRCVHFRKPL